MVVCVLTSAGKGAFRGLEEGAIALQGAIQRGGEELVAHLELLLAFTRGV